MEKTLRFLGLAAVIGVCAIVVAQQSARSPQGAAATSQAGGGAAVASKSEQSFRNSALILMSQYFCAKQNLEIERAENAGLQDRVQPIIRATCAANLMLLTPEAQQREIAGWQLGTYAPGSTGWAKVAQTKSMAHALGLVSKKVEDQVAALIDAVWEPVRHGDDALVKKVLASDEWKNAKSEHERNMVLYRARQADALVHPPAPLIERRKASVARYEEAMAKARPLLTTAQQAEFDAITNRFEESIRLAVAGEGEYK
jgi:hypothetical protein